MALSLFRERKFCFLALLAGLTAVYFTLIWQADDTGHLAISGLFYFCVGTLLWEKRAHLSFKLHWPSCGLGLFLIGWMLTNSSCSTNEYVVRLFPVVSGVGVALIASGWQQLKQYSQILLLLFFLSVPSVLAYYWVDIAPLTAKVSELMLWYAGFDVRLQGIILAIHGRQPIKVIYDCSGIDTVLYMLGLSIACLVMFPISGFKRFVFPCIAIAVGFFLNSIRVAMLAVMLGSDQAAFDKWHTGTGSYTFALIGVIILGAIYWVLLSHNPGADGGNADELM